MNALVKIRTDVSVRSSEIRPHSIHDVQHLLRPHEQPPRLSGHGVRPGGRNAAEPLLSPGRIKVPALALEAASATLADGAEPVAVEPLAAHGAPHVIPKVPVRGADVKVAHAAPRPVVPRARIELVTWPGIPHRYLDANPGPQFALNFTNVPCKGAETRTL
jgi:hypothetical protein